MNPGRAAPERGQPIVWSIAGSDSGGGAGIQADLRTLSALGAHGCSVVTAITAQSSRSVHAVEPVSGSALLAQLTALREDLPPGAVKLGMLGNGEAVETIARSIGDLRAPVVCDPVLASSSGAPLLTEEGFVVLREKLFPRVELLTPNLPEAERITGRSIRDASDVEKAANHLLTMGVSSVLVKGGHGDGSFSQDFYLSASEKAWLTSPRREGPSPRGTGCTLSSALAAAFAFGLRGLDAAVAAKAYVNQCLRMAFTPGTGSPLLRHEPWQVSAGDYPWSSAHVEQGGERLLFPDCGPEPLGFYPIVDRVSWLERLLPVGVRTAQLRIKDLRGRELEREIQQAIELARTHRCRLFINDYWEPAIRYGAYGVHLGQEDLETADLRSIAGAGLRLGVSTHCHSEAARAHSLRPSYIAIGPIFPTTLKAMRFSPQGVAAFRDWRKMLDYPLVAIGGITLETAGALYEAGADSIAVVSDITRNPSPEERARMWLGTRSPA